MLKRKIATAALIAAAGVAAAAGSAQADSGTRQDDLAPHSQGPVMSLINGDTSVTGVHEANVPVNIPVGGSKTGPQQLGNERSAPQNDAPVYQENQRHTGTHDLAGGLPVPPVPSLF